MKKEFIIGLLLNLKELLGVVGILSFMGLIVAGLICAFFSQDYPMDHDRMRMTFQIMEILGIGTIIGAIAGIIPDPDDIFETRVALLKLELTNKENSDKIMEKGAEALDKIVEHLENKYFKQDK